jgi:predicted deacetylase
VNELHAALDAATTPVELFLRDDDGGWDDARLFALLDCTERAGVPIDVAMIPQATHAPLAASLGARIRAAPQLVGVHQHGFAHANHETIERKCEFGGARSLHAQREDLLAGRERLRELFGTRLDPIFTPPWNRCSASTPALLAELGFAALSRDRGAATQSALPEIAVDLDWCKQRRAAQAAGEDLHERVARELARCITQHQTVGVMLHHADMEAGELVLLAELLVAVKAHPQACWRSMREVSASLPAAL